MNPDEFRHELALIPWIGAADELPEPLRTASLADPLLMAIVRERVLLDDRLDQVPEIDPDDTFVFRTVQRAWRDAAEGPKRGPSAVGADAGRSPRSVDTAGVDTARVGTSRVVSRGAHHRPLWIAAAALAVGLTIGLFAGRFLGVDAPEPDLLAKLDFLLDLDLIEENRPGLDVHRTCELIEAVVDLSDLREGGG